MTDTQSDSSMMPSAPILSPLQEAKQIYSEAEKQRRMQASLANLAKGREKLKQKRAQEKEQFVLDTVAKHVGVGVPTVKPTGVPEPPPLALPQPVPVRADPSPAQSPLLTLLFTLLFSYLFRTIGQYVSETVIPFITPSVKKNNEPVKEKPPFDEKSIFY